MAEVTFPCPQSPQLSDTCICVHLVSLTAVPVWRMKGDAGLILGLLGSPLFLH